MVRATARHESAEERLHTRVYEKVRSGQGFGIADARPSIELAHRIRHAPVTVPRDVPPQLVVRR